MKKIHPPSTPQFNGTVSELLAYNNEFERMPPALSWCLRSKKNEFYKNNGQRIQSIVDRFNDLQRKYFVVEHNKELNADVVKTEGEGKDKKPVLLDGLTMEDYNKEFEAMMNEGVNINL